MSIISINPKQFAKLLQEGKKVELIDVRTPVEFQEFHVDIAKNIPLTDLNPVELMRSRSTSVMEPLYLICRSGGRGKQACEKFIKAGYSNITNIEGGTLACEDAGLLIIRGKKSVSLERQVRISAGALVFVGTILGWLIDPAFLLVSGFVGAGLIFAGITDKCGMGIILARMPWNQGSQNKNFCCISTDKPNLQSQKENL